MVGRSLASSFHGIPRATIDADLVAALRSEHVSEFVGALATSFYLDADAVRSAVEDRASFNVIHLETMFKVDVFVAGNDRATELELDRGRAFVVSDDPERSLRIATPEDTIAQKLYWYTLGDGVSDRQWSDAMGVLRVTARALDLSYLRHVASLLDVPELLEKALLEAGLSG